MPLDNISVADPSYYFCHYCLKPIGIFSSDVGGVEASIAMSIAFKKHIAAPEQKDGKTAVGKRRKDSQKDLDRRSLMRLNSPLPFCR